MTTAKAKRKHILFITTSRSDFASIERLFISLRKEKHVRPLLFVTGDHLRKDAGETYRDIEARGMHIDWRYHTKARGPAQQVAEVTRAVADALSSSDIDCAVVCGDRRETFAAAIACALSGVPLFHIHGGDVTFGMIDDAMRHAITKLAAIHFAATALSARRICQMGEEPWRVFVTGSPDVDGLKAASRGEVLKKMDLQEKGYALLLLNPETLLDAAGNTALARAGITALRTYKGKVVVLPPNADPSAGGIKAGYQTLQRDERFLFVPSLPREQYLELLQHAAFLIGNSSSGITEAATFKVPVINVGARQSGREHGRNVLDIPAHAAALERAVRKVQSKAFIRSLREFQNPYGNGHASERMRAILLKLLNEKGRTQLLNKKFIII